MDNKEKIKKLRKYLKEAENKLNDNLCGDEELVDYLKSKVEFEKDALKKHLKKEC